MMSSREDDAFIMAVPRPRMHLHNSTIYYLTPPSFFIINHASSSSILMKQYNNVGVAHRCPQSSTPEQQPINIIGDINIVEATQHSNHIAIVVV
jgi:hypothetical protein